MDDQSRLALLKANVSAIGSTLYDDLFLSLLTSAVSMIEREGITLDMDSQEDNNLIVGYATWLFQQREQPDMQMPRWLRYNLNNKVLQQKAVSADE
jgi:hypothetical protein